MSCYDCKLDVDVMMLYRVALLVNRGWTYGEHMDINTETVLCWHKRGMTCNRYSPVETAYGQGFVEDSECFKDTDDAYEKEMDEW